ncbi:hypothetical protein [Geomicrobium sp. JCM 19055]|uniref:hypothetical protein n=1 Tax=Geomicrobium sp. JCM 19055 TaxID=1460649 RepID=UPI0012692FCA|nr:hypothetical protein [Geomicrobium sp. JCM 19055]
MKTLLPHVAIKKHGNWISPVQYEAYKETYFEYDRDGHYSFRFINAGFIAELVFILVCVPIFNVVIGYPPLSISLLLTALVIYIVYLGMSIVMTIRTRYPWGDFGAMWHISKLQSAILIMLSIAIKASLLVYSISLV